MFILSDWDVSGCVGCVYSCVQKKWDGVLYGLGWRRCMNTMGTQLYTHFLLFITCWLHYCKVVFSDLNNIIVIIEQDVHVSDSSLPIAPFLATTLMINSRLRDMH